MTIPAKFEDGVFRPLEAVRIKEGTVVEVHVPAEKKPEGQRRSIKDLPFLACGRTAKISAAASST
jgi:predicted DNA-binding antitoxin AbrB/MazE fold protein